MPTQDQIDQFIRAFDYVRTREKPRMVKSSERTYRRSQEGKDAEKKALSVFTNGSLQIPDGVKAIKVSDPGLKGMMQIASNTNLYENPDLQGDVSYKAKRGASCTIHKTDVDNVFFSSTHGYGNRGFE